MNICFALFEKETSLSFKFRCISLKNILFESFEKLYWPTDISNSFKLFDWAFQMKTPLSNRFCRTNYFRVLLIANVCVKYWGRRPQVNPRRLQLSPRTLPLRYRRPKWMIGKRINVDTAILILWLHSSMYFAFVGEAFCFEQIGFEKPVDEKTFSL